MKGNSPRKAGSTEANPAPCRFGPRQVSRPEFSAFARFATLLPVRNRWFHCLACSHTYPLGRRLIPWRPDFVFRGHQAVREGTQFLQDLVERSKESLAK
jgi:hypothetical protein